jgi:hypothetical protein
MKKQLAFWCTVLAFVLAVIAPMFPQVRNLLSNSTLVDVSGNNNQVNINKPEEKQKPLPSPPQISDIAGQWAAPGFILSDSDGKDIFYKAMRLQINQQGQITGSVIQDGLTKKTDGTLHRNPNKDIKVTGSISNLMATEEEVMSFRFQVIKFDMALKLDGVLATSDHAQFLKPGKISVKLKLKDTIGTLHMERF